LLVLLKTLIQEQNYNLSKSAQQLSSLILYLFCRF